MKRVMRDNVWETNSSSMHTVTVRGKRNINNHYRINDIIEVYLDEYGWDGDPCDDFMSKLAYAMSMVLHTEYPSFNHYDEDFIVDQEILEELPGYQLLINAIREHGYCERIVIKRRDGAYYPYGYIDHQSFEDYSSLQDFLDDWHVDAETLLFDDNVTIWIDNDNH